MLYNILLGLDKKIFYANWETYPPVNDFYIVCIHGCMFHMVNSSEMAIS